MYTWAVGHETRSWKWGGAYGILVAVAVDNDSSVELDSRRLPRDVTVVAVVAVTVAVVVDVHLHFPRRDC